MKALLCRFLLIKVCAVAWTIACVGRMLRRPRRRAVGRMFATGTFYNDNWFLSHARPLAAAGLGEVVFVADEPLSVTMPNGVRFDCPPRWLRKCAGRAGSKALWMTWLGIRDGADVFMGYHIFPGAITALIASAIGGGRAVYQMTGGPIEMIGGGWQAENPVMAAIGKPSPWVERWMVQVVRRFDRVIVRGQRAAEYIRGLHGRGQVDVITGSVDIPDVVRDQQDRRCDMLFVGRLGAMKRPVLFVETVARVRDAFPDVRAMMIGGGAMASDVREAVERLELTANIDVIGQSDDVATAMHDSRLFLLTSSSEGLSISMLEAMATGCVVVVSDVGELSDVVRDGVTGHLVRGGQAGEFADCVTRLLGDGERCAALASAGREAAIAMASVEAVGVRWQASLGDWMGKGG